MARWRTVVDERYLVALGAVALLAPNARAQQPAPPPAVAVDEDQWPLAYVRRPLTLRAGMIEAILDVGGFKPASTANVDPVTGPYDFHSSLRIGGGVALGMTDHLQVSAFMPRVFCVDGDKQPSRCSPWNRYYGTGLGIAYGFFQRPRNQAALAARVSVVGNDPLRLGWSLGGTLKTLAVVDRLALVMGLSLARSFDDPPNGIGNPLLAHIVADVNLQITTRFLLFATLFPTASLGDLGEGIVLAYQGGATFTFNRHVEVWAAAGATNVLDQPRWLRDTKGWFGAVALVFWSY